jgi:hypothetical protein
LPRLSPFESGKADSVGLTLSLVARVARSARLVMISLVTSALKVSSGPSGS